MNATFDFSRRLKAYCTNIQAEYEAFLFGIELLGYMGVKHVKVFGDSQLFLQQILREYQCLHGLLTNFTFNIYQELSIPKLMTWHMKLLAIG
jgi:ribonuclease HI